MRYTSKDLPVLVERVERLVSQWNMDLNDFDITVDEIGTKVRVEHHKDGRGFIVNLFATWDLESLKQRMKEWQQ